MQENLKKFSGKAFKYCGQIYTVDETKIVNHKAVIKTDLKSFVKLPSELDAFMDDIEFVKIVKHLTEKSIENAVYKEKRTDVITKSKEWIPTDRVPAIPTPFEAEILVAETNAAKVSNKLMEMFEQLAGKPTKDTYEQATAMVSMANSIVNVQMAQIKFLSLKK